MAKTRGAFVFEEKNSVFQQLHPTTRTVFLLCAINITFCLQHPLLLLAFYVIVLIVALTAKMSKQLMLVYFGLIGTGALMAFLSWIPFGGDVSGHVYYESRSFLGISIALSDTGMMWAVSMAIRILASSLPVFLYISSTRLRDINIGFSKLGIPFTVSQLFVLAFRFVPLVENDAAIITEAQRARGVDFNSGGLKEKARKYSAVLAPMIFISLRRIQLVANSLDTKGFRNKSCNHRFYKSPQFYLRDFAVITICILLFGLTIYARIKGFAILVPTRL